MNVYDEANSLAKALSSSDEYKRLKRAENALREDEKALEIVRDYAGKQGALHMRQMIGETPTPEEIAAFNQLTQTVMGIPAAAEYLQSRDYLFVVLNDVMKTITDAVEIDPDLLRAPEEEDGAEPQSDQTAE